MIPLLYKKDGITKIGELTNCIECLVEEERNGIFEVSIIYPTTDSIFNSLEEENIIICDANDTLKAQKFRIYMTRKLMSNRIEVYARHISFDLAYDTVDNIDITNQSCEYALNTIFRQSQFSTHYKGYSDIVNAQNYKMSMANCIEAIAGKEGSIIDTFGTGAEILRDNTNIHVLNKRGHDNEVAIEYAKNLTGFELEEDYSELVTRINAYAKYTNSETNKEVLVEAKGIDSPLITNYSHPYVAYIDYSDKFENEEIPTKEKLIELAKKEYSINNKDKPKQNYKIEFVPLSKCVGYEGLEDKISLCDTVTIKDTRYGINTKSKVIRTVFDVLKNRYDSMELGEPRTTLGDIIGGSGEDGEVGPPGPQGPPGADGNIGDFPNSLPSVPVLSAKVYGFANIELSWTFENKVYYQYELYASKIKDFTPNTFDIIHQGQSSSFLFQAKPSETWYFRVCAVNSHGERTAFSPQVKVATIKVDNLSNYVSDMAIGDALIDTLNLGRGWYGELRGNYIDARQLSVTDGNGKRTLDIDSFGNVSLDVTKLKISSKSVATKESVQSNIETAKEDVLKEVQEVNSSLNDLNNTMNGAFKDGIVDLSEAKLIAERLNELDKEKLDIDSQYNIVYSNNYLSGDPKTNLKNAKISYDDKHENLKVYINTSIEDSKVTGDEKYNIKIKMASYSESLALINKRLHEALDYVTSKKKEEAINTSNTYTNSQIEVLNNSISLKVDSKTYNSQISNINKYIDDTKKALGAEITDVSNSLNNLSNTMNNAFKDGIINETEAKIIEDSIKQLDKEKLDVDSKYNTVYVNTDLTGTAKTNLKSAKDSYNAKHENLVAYINTSIEDKKVTGDEKYNIKVKIASYSEALALVSKRLQEAMDSIAEKKKSDSIDVAKTYTNAQVEILNNSITSKVSKTDYDKNNTVINNKFTEIKQTTDSITSEVNKKVGSEEVKSIIKQNPEAVNIAFNGISSEWIFDTNKFTNKIDGKIGLTLGHGRLNVSRFEDGKPVGYYGQTFSEIPNSTQKYWGNVISGTYRSYYTDIGYNPNVKEEGDSTASGFDPFMKMVFYPYGTAYPSQGIYVFKDMILQQKLEVLNALKLHWHVDLGTNNQIRLGNENNALWCMYSNRWRSTNREITIIPGVNTYGGIMIDGNGYVKPINTGGAYSLGTTQNPFYKLYSVEPVSITSDKRVKTDIVYLDEHAKPVSLGDRMSISTELTTEDFRNFIKDTLRLASYRYNIALEKGDTETNIGFIAQDILYDKIGSNIVQLTDKNDLNSELRYNQGNYISVIAGALQEEITLRDNQIEVLEKENKDLKSRLDKIEKMLGITE